MSIQENVLNKGIERKSAEAMNTSTLILLCAVVGVLVGEAVAYQNNEGKYFVGEFYNN